VMVDSYIWGKVDRISPEAPVPVVLVNRRSNMLGGAANVALNIKSLGAEPILCSVIGNDLRGNDFIELLENDDISTKGIIQSTGRITTTKFRIIGNKTQLLRVDEETDSDLDELELKTLKDKLVEILADQKIDVIILQDYNKGVLTADVIPHIIALGKEKGIPVVVDPKRKNFSLYRRVDLLKPNLKELAEGLKMEFKASDLSKINEACIEWQRKQEITSLMVTLSERGVYMREEVNGATKEFHIPAHVRNIADVSGAGDTVISVASLCRALRVDTELTAALANIAGGLVCEHVGVVPVSGKMLLMEAKSLLSSDKNAKRNSVK
jgi:rfaE bifunctional protein kinase chain/domain